MAKRKIELKPLTPEGRWEDYWSADQLSDFAHGYQLADDLALDAQVGKVEDEVWPDDCHGLHYVFFNPNPRGRRTNDCAKRALVVALGCDYLWLERAMNANKAKPSLPYNYMDNWVPFAEECLGGAKLRCSFPRRGEDNWRVTTINEALKGSRGTFVLQVAGHLVGWRGGAIFDTVDDRLMNKMVYAAWAFGLSEAEAAAVQAKLAGPRPRAPRF